MRDVEKFVELHKNETILMRLRQSHISPAIAPDSIILTNKRVIIVHHSFWGLYFNHNILEPTRVITAALSNISGTSLTDGKFLATIHIRIKGSVEQTNSPISGLHVDGVWIKQAMKFTEMVDGFTEGNENSILSEVTIKEARKMLEQGKSEVIWLGIEAPSYVAYMLGLDPSKVSRLNPADIISMSPEGIKELEGKIFVYYSGNVSSEIVGLIEREYGAHAYILKGGLVGAMQADKEGGGS